MRSSALRPCSRWTTRARPWLRACSGPTRSHARSPCSQARDPRRLPQRVTCSTQRRPITRARMPGARSSQPFEPADLPRRVGPIPAVMSTRRPWNRTCAVSNARMTPPRACASLLRARGAAQRAPDNAGVRAGYGGAKRPGSSRNRSHTARPPNESGLGKRPKNAHTSNDFRTELAFPAPDYRPACSKAASAAPNRAGVGSIPTGSASPGRRSGTSEPGRSRRSSARPESEPGHFPLRHGESCSCFECWRSRRHGGGPVVETRALVGGCELVGRNLTNLCLSCLEVVPEGDAHPCWRVPA